MPLQYILVLVFCSLFSQHILAQNNNLLNIKIVQTTDLHGAIFPFDFVNNKKTDYSLANISNFLNKVKNEENAEIILLDNGDILQGQPVVYYSNFESIDKKHICASVMNFMKYDAATIGNHDIEAGHDVYDKIRNEFDFPWLAANAVDEKNKKPYFKPYTVIDRKGVKIAVLGLITPAIPNWLPENIWEGIQFEDMVESAKKWVDIIQKKENPDLLVGLFHAGFNHTYNNQDEATFKNENASKLVALNIPGFDIVFAGHDHKILNEKIKNSSNNEVLLLNGGSHARMAAVANIYFDIKQSENIIKKIEGELVDIKKYEPDSVFLSKFDDYYKETLEYVNRTIGTCSKSISAKESLFGNSEFIDFIHKVQLEIGNAEISFTSPLSYNFTIEKGDIKVRDMFKLYRFENLLYTMELSGQEIKDYLEYSAGLWFNQMQSKADSLLMYSVGKNNRVRFKNPFYNYSSAAGINYIVDVSKPIGKRITIKSLESGKKFKLNKKYKVAINSYRGNGGGYHLTKGAKIDKNELKNRIIFSTDKDLRYYIIKYIEKTKIISPEKRNNWSIVPEEWVEEAKKKEYKLLSVK